MLAAEPGSAGGVKLAATPAGTPEMLKEMVELKPPVGLTETERPAEEPGTSVTAAEELEKVKLGDVMVSVVVALATRFAPVAVIVTV